MILFKFTGFTLFLTSGHLTTKLLPFWPWFRFWTQFCSVDLSGSQSVHGVGLSLGPLVVSG